MQIRITSEGDAYALTELQSWLARDPGTAALKVRPVTGQGPTMNVFEALDIIFGHATDLAAFAVAYATWRTTKANDRSPAGEATGGARTLTHEGTTLDIGHLSPQELADLLRRLNEGGRSAGSPDGGDPDSGPRA
ncbi:hypothetical protein ACGFYP_33125 [Streptomyces sp. NPDC048370]|uniref:effector-associated constant component EACC1 n=1 Tax=Streptomyces sp. NPDC048370 TaxID=3365540 RepID=UPI0037183201